MKCHSCLKNKIENKYLLCNECAKNLMLVKNGCKYCNSYFKVNNNVCFNCIKQNNKTKINVIFRYNDFIKNILLSIKNEQMYYKVHIFKWFLLVNKIKYINYSWIYIPSSIKTQKINNLNINGIILSNNYIKICNNIKIINMNKKQQVEKTLIQREKVNFDIQVNGKIPSRIIIFDDIYTSGYSCQNLKHRLQKLGVKQIKFVILAR